MKWQFLDNCNVPLDYNLGTYIRPDTSGLGHNKK